MADEGRLGLIVDADGALRNIRLTSAELEKLANTGKLSKETLKKAVPPDMVPPQTVPSINRVTDAIKRMQDVQRASQANAMASMIKATDPFQQSAVVAEKAAVNFGKLRGALTGVAQAAIGTSGPLGSLLSIVGTMALGSGVMVAALAGIAALAFAWDKYTTKTREAEKASKEAMARLADLAKQQRQGAFGDTPEDVGQAWKKALAATADIRRLESLGDVGKDILGRNVQQRALEAARKRQKEALDAIVAGNRQISTIQTDLDEKETQRLAEVNDERLRNLIAAMQAQEDVVQRFARQRKEFTENNKAANDFGITASVGLSATRASGSLPVIPIFDSLAAVAQRAKQAVDEAARTARVNREMAESDARGAALKGIVGNSALSLINAFGGEKTHLLTGVGQSAMLGMAAGGPWGAAIAGIASLTTGLLGMRKASQEARAEHEREELQYKANIAATRTLLGQMSPLEKSLYDVRSQFDELRNKLDPKDLQTYSVRLAELNTLEAQRIAQIQKEAIEERQYYAENLQARLLRAQGRTEEADNLAFLTQQHKEYTDAIKAGRSEVELANLAEVQRAETIARSIDKLKTQIAGYSATIDGLKSFKDALLLSDTAGLSPAAKLAEAQRQYDEILKAAKSGDQGAAGRLPQAAQALLDIARTVFGSSGSFQDILQRVLADTDSTIRFYEDARTIAQQQLDELKHILDAIKLQTEVIKTRTTNRDNVNDNTDNPPQSTDPDSLKGVMAGGFSAVVGEIQTLTAAVEANTRVNRVGFEGFAA